MASKKSKPKPKKGRNANGQIKKGWHLSECDGRMRKAKRW